MLRRLSLAAAAGLLLAALAGSTALAAEPFASCGSARAEQSPPGFNTDGFTAAALLYAGSEKSHSLVSGNGNAVSQYDIACVHFTAAH